LGKFRKKGPREERGVSRRFGIKKKKEGPENLSVLIQACREKCPQEGGGRDRGPVKIPSRGESWQRGGERPEEWNVFLGRFAKGGNDYCKWQGGESQKTPGRKGGRKKEETVCHRPERGKKGSNMEEGSSSLWG